MPKISCVIVSYNNIEFLERAVRSVLEQTCPVDEIIIADDGSTDGSRELITSFDYKEPKIRPILREQNIGVAANRDLAIRSACFDLITTLDGDDFYLPGKIEHELGVIMGQSDSVAFSDIVLVDRNGRTIKRLDLLPISNLTQKERMSLLVNRNGNIPRDMLISKHLYLKAGGIRHDLTVYEDWDFKIRLASLTPRWTHSGTEGVAYRKTGYGLSSLGPVTHLRSQYKVIRSNRKIIVERLGILFYMESFLKLIYNWIKATVLASR